MILLAAHAAALSDTDREKWTLELPPKKREEVSSMRREQDRDLTLTAYRLLRFGLSVYYGIVAEACSWRRTPFGKPCLIEGPCFNLSHSGEMALCALHEREVGVDVERVRPVEDSLARRVMSDAEYEAYLAATDKTDFFFRVWTMKEAYIKFLGEGLRRDLRSFSVYPMDAGIVTDLRGCRLTMLETAAGYRGAVCTPDQAEGRLVWVLGEQLKEF